MALRRCLVIVLLLSLPACATNPVTGQRQLSLISEAQEIELGRQAAREAEQSIGLVQSPELQTYVGRIGTALAARSERPSLPWSFRVVDDPTPNAFALPGGFIFVTRGLLHLMDSEAELASVLGHEIGHVTAKHSVTQISNQQLAQLGLGVGGILLPELQPVGQALGAGLQLLFLKHGRDAERQADELAFRYAGAQGYDVAEMADVFEALGRIGEKENGSALPSWLATHPTPADRIAAVRQMVAKRGPGDPASRRDRAEYLGRIDGMVYGDNPRHGFFRDGVFYHPDFRFQFAIPEGWQHANLAQAVVAVNREQNAAAQLTLAGDVTPEEAMRRFLSQSGIQAQRPARDSLNGIPAVVTEFQAQTEQGIVAGYVAYPAHGGRTYQLVAYATGGAYSRSRDTLARIVRSFAPVSDQSILDVQPRRIEIEKVPRGMTLAEFNRSNPSSVPVETLAIINQVPSASATIPAGTLVKRVVGEDPAGDDVTAR